MEPEPAANENCKESWDYGPVQGIRELIKDQRMVVEKDVGKSQVKG